MKKTLLNWNGNKVSCVDSLISDLNAIIEEKKITRLVEPFVGSGVVSLNVNSVDSFLINDVNKDLMAIYEGLKNEGEEYISSLSGFFSFASNNVLYFKEMSDRFNKSTNPYFRGLLYYYLNSYALNNLPRYGKSGEYNATFGIFKEVDFPKENLIKIAKTLQQMNFEISAESYEKVFSALNKNDLIYCDPPSLGSVISNDSPVDFTIEDHKKLKALIDEALDKGCSVVLSTNTSSAESEIYQFSNVKAKKITKQNIKVKNFKDDFKTFEYCDEIYLILG